MSQLHHVCSASLTYGIVFHVWAFCSKTTNRCQHVLLVLLPHAQCKCMQKQTLIAAEHVSHATEDCQTSEEQLSTQQTELGIGRHDNQATRLRACCAGLLFQAYPLLLLT